MKRTLFVLALIVIALAAIGVLLIRWAAPQTGGIGSVSFGGMDTGIVMIVLVPAILAVRALLIRYRRRM